MKHYVILLLLFIALVMTACSSDAVTLLNQPQVKPETIPSIQSPITSTQDSATQTFLPDDAQQLQLPELTDSQGAVTVIVKPLGLDNLQEKLYFDVTLDTHSLDLKMDLASLATLMIDKGQSFGALVWDAPLGGHHVSGVLSFPAREEGKLILDGALKMTMVIKDVDAQERIFVWDLT